MRKLGLVSNLLVGDAKRVLFPYPRYHKEGFSYDSGLGAYR